MQNIKMSTFEENMSYYVKWAQKGSIFVYPTDTIYGIGGIVTQSVIKKVDTFKKRKMGKYYSIIAPSFGRIEKNFDVPNDFESIRNSYKHKHGPLTLLLPLKNSDELIGIRYIDHPFQLFVSILGEPFITTSVNISGEPSISNCSQISQDQLELIDFIIENGDLSSSGSTIINFITGEKIR